MMYGICWWMVAGEGLAGVISDNGDRLENFVVVSCTALLW